MGVLGIRAFLSISMLNSLYCSSWATWNPCLCLLELTFSLVVIQAPSISKVLNSWGIIVFNVQMYLQSTTVRLEEWRIRRTDTEEWMRHRQLPRDLKQNVRRYDQYRWVTTRGVDEEDILKGLPMDLRRDIKRHLCLDLVRQVGFPLPLSFLWWMNFVNFPSSYLSNSWPYLTWSISC